MKAFLTAGLSLAACAAFAAIPTQTFDTAGTLDNTIWFGVDGTKVSGGVLAVEGTAICSNAAAAVASEFVKTSFKVKAPEDETTELPTGAELEGCQIAIATGAASGDDLKVMVYAITNANTAGWADTGLTVATGTEFTVTLSFDYMQTNVTVQIDRSSADPSSAGPYTLVTPPDNNATTAKINSLNFVGSTEIDDVGIDEALAMSQLASTLDGLQIYTNSLPAGVTVDDLKEDNIYTKHIEAGLTPSDAPLAFNATALTTVTEGNTVKTVITVPCNADYGQVYKVVITGAAGNLIDKVDAEAGAISGNSRALKFEVPATEAKVLKFNVEVGAPAAN